MRIQPLASALRVTLTLGEARAIRLLISAGEESLGHLAPTTSKDLAAMLDIGIHDVASKQADVRARKKAATRRSASPPHRNLTVDGYTISAHMGDWIDVSPDLDSRAWVAVTSERAEQQDEIRRDTWRVGVLNPDRTGAMFLAIDCTHSPEEDEIEEVARRLVRHLPAIEAAA